MAEGVGLLAVPPGQVGWTAALGGPVGLAAVAEGLRVVTEALVEKAVAKVVAEGVMEKAVVVAEAATAATAALMAADSWAATVEMRVVMAETATAIPAAVTVEAAREESREEAAETEETVGQAEAVVREDLDSVEAVMATVAAEVVLGVEREVATEALMEDQDCTEAV